MNVDVFFNDNAIKEEMEINVGNADDGGDNVEVEFIENDKTKARKEEEIQVFEMSQVRLGEVVGRGTFATVYAAELSPDRQQIAIKLFNSKASLENLAREISVLAALKHDNIVRFLGVVWDSTSPERPAVAMEFCTMGSLFQALHTGAADTKTRRGQLFAAPSPVFAHRKYISFGVSCAMAHMHRVGYSHFDLCSANVLLSGEKMTPKLADFGQARRCFGVGFPAVGHEAYRAPELCYAPSKNYSRSTHWSEKADVYSFSILLWELLHGELPWAGCADIGKSVREGYRPTLSNTNICPHEWRELIRGCWADSPQERPPFSVISSAIESLSLPFEQE